MGSGIDYRFLLMIMWQVWIRRTGIKSELNYFHSREVIAITQSSDIRRDYSQVFGNDWQFPEGSEYRIKQRCSGSLDPGPVDSGFLTRRYMPCGLKAPEMIDTDDVKELEHRTKTLDPPRVLPAPHLFPVIQGISPKLTGGAEIIRRHSRNSGRLTLRIEKKQFTTTPHISGIVADKNRYIANNGNSFCGRICSQFTPLPEKLPLNIFLDAYLSSQLNGSFFIRCRRQKSHLSRPFFPRAPFVSEFQRHKQRIVVKPWGRIAISPEFLFAWRGIVC